MDFLIYVGIALASIGILGIGYCVKTAVSIRKEPDEDVAKNRLQGLVAWNLGALSLSALGLIIVIVGMVM